MPPSRVERALRARVAAMVTAQAVEDEAELRGRPGAPLPHRYNAVLKRLFGNKSRAAMTAEELEAALAWLERNRLQDHLHLLEGDSRYAWSARRRWAGWSGGRGDGRRLRHSVGAAIAGLAVSPTVDEAYPFESPPLLPLPCGRAGR